MTEASRVPPKFGTSKIKGVLDRKKTKLNLLVSSNKLENQKEQTNDIFGLVQLLKLQNTVNNIKGHSEEQEDEDGLAQVEELVAELSVSIDESKVIAGDLVEFWDDDYQQSITVDQNDDDLPNIAPEFRIHVASLNGLIHFLTLSDCDKGFEKAFFITMKNFCLPPLFLKKLIQRFHVPATAKPPRGNRDRWETAIQQRTIAVMDRWINTCYSDFLADPSLKTRVQEFTLSLQRPDHLRYRTLIINSLTHKSAGALRKQARGMSLAGSTSTAAPRILRVNCPEHNGAVKTMIVSPVSTVTDMVIKLREKLDITSSDKKYTIVEVRGGVGKVLAPDLKLYDLLDSETPVEGRSFEFKAIETSNQKIVVRVYIPDVKQTKVLQIQSDSTTSDLMSSVASKILLSEEDTQHYQLRIASSKSESRCLDSDEVLGPLLSSSSSADISLVRTDSTSSLSEPASQDISVLRFDEEIMAEELTVKAFSLFSAVESSEVVGNAWNSKNCEVDAPNVLALITQFNLVSNWVVESIVSQETISRRVAVMSKMIRLADHLEALRNFNTLMAVVAGLNNSSVMRLKHTYSEVKKKLRTRLAALETLVSCEYSYKEYRSALASSPSNPTVPYFGLLLSDLTFADDGNPGRTSQGYINFRKQFLLSKIIMNMLQAQTISYHGLESSPQYTAYLDTFKSLPCDEAVQYKASLTLEPRGFERSSIA